MDVNVQRKDSLLLEIKETTYSL